MVYTIWALAMIRFHDSDWQTCLIILTDNSMQTGIEECGLEQELTHALRVHQCLGRLPGKAMRLYPSFGAVLMKK